MPTRGNVQNQELTILASAARTADTVSELFINEAHLGILILIDITAAADTPSVVFTVQSEINGVYSTVLASAAKTGISQTVLLIYPTITASANLKANDVLPHRWRVDCNHADTDSITYSIKAHLLV